MTESILKDFLSECFINPYEAIKRVSARKERINSLKKENPKITEDELKAILTDILLHFTFRSKFLEYIQKFIKTRYNTETIANYKIDSKLLLKTFRNNKEYSKLYVFKNVQAEYIYHKKGKVFMYLSLKMPWHILDKELESKDVNNIICSAAEENVVLSLYDQIKREIDFQELPFYSA